MFVNMLLNSIHAARKLEIIKVADGKKIIKMNLQHEGIELLENTRLCK